MLDKLMMVKDILNGEEAATFKTEFWGEHLSGAVTLTFGTQPYTLTFYRGTVIEVVKGFPLTGTEFGVAGPEEGWQELYEHKNFHRAIAPKHGKLRLQGNMVKAMGNLNPLAFMARVLCRVM